MPLSPAPTGPTDWATSLINNGPEGGPNRIDPSVPRQTAGWYWGDKPDYETLNGWQYNVGKKLEWAINSITTHDAQIGGLGSTFGIDENNMSTVAYPAGGTYSNTGNVSGSLKVTLPNSWTDTRMRLFVDIFEEDSGTTTSLLISGFNTISSGWNDNQAYLVAGNSKLRVRLGHDGAKCCIVIGSTSDTWYSPHVRLRSFTGHGGASWQYANWISNWGVSFIVSEAGIAFTGNELTSVAYGDVEDLLITSSYNVAVGDIGKRIVLTSSTVADATVGISSALASSGKVIIRNESDYVLTVSATSGSIEGRASKELFKGQQIELQLNATSTIKILSGTFFEDNAIMHASVASSNYLYIESASNTIAHTWDSVGGESAVNTCAEMFTSLDTFLTNAKKVEVEILYQHLAGGFDNEPSTFLRSTIDFEKGEIKGDFTHCGGNTSALIGYFDDTLSAGDDNYSGSYLYNSAGFDPPIWGVNSTTRKITKIPIIGYDYGSTIHSIKFIKHF